MLAQARYEIIDNMGKEFKKDFFACNNEHLFVSPGFLE